MWRSFLFERGDNLLPITDLNGQTELLTNLKGLRRKRRVNGEKTLEFFVIPDKSNEHSYGMVDTESIVEFDGEEYIIKQANEKNVGKKTIKQVSAVHRFFDDMINNFQYKQRSGSMTFATACQFVFEETNYTFNIIDPFLAESFENFGRDNCLSLFKTILERYGAEFYVLGNQVYIKRKIGVNGDFQYRYAHNVKTIDKEITTRNLATIIKGFGGELNSSGVYPIQEEYISPNVAIFGEKHAPAIYDERITTVEGMQDRLQKTIIDEPELSITIDLVDLRASGYNYHTASEGDYGFIIYEPMNVDVEARIVEIDEEYDANLKPLKTAVTLSNLRQSMTDVMTRMQQTTKTVNRILEGNQQIPYNVLDDAVKIATEALKSAQTELEFNNGIIARDKVNPNELVVYNSKGLGVSQDGGQTFPDAVTGKGINTNLLTAGQIKTNNIQIVGQDDLFYWDGNELIAINSSDPDKWVRLNSNGLYAKKGTLTAERDDGYPIVIGGKANFDFGIDSANPPFMDSGVTISGYYYRVNNTDRAACNFYTFKHTGRYLKVQVAYHIEDDQRGSTGGIYIRNRGNTANLASLFFTRSENDIVHTFTIDLGVPTGQLDSFYIQANTTNSLSPVYVRKIRAWLEG